MLNRWLGECYLSQKEIMKSIIFDPKKMLCAWSENESIS